MNHVPATVVVVCLSWVAVRAADLDITVLSEGTSTVFAGAGTVLTYEIIGELTDANNQGLAGFVFDLTYSGGPLLTQAIPGSEVMSFVMPNGVTNPEGFGGALAAGGLVQVGGAQNTINNNVCPYPIGSLDLGIGQVPVVLAMGTLTAPADHGEYVVEISNVWASVIKTGEEGPVYATESAGAGTIEPLTIIVGANRPMPEDCAMITPGSRCSATGTCTLDTDCANESYCVPPPTGASGSGICYAPKTRYLSIVPHPGRAPNTARRVRLDGYAAEQFEYWVREPIWNATTAGHELWLSELVDAPVYAGGFVTPDGDWPVLLHLTGCHIAPGYTYLIQAIVSGCDTANEENYSEALPLHTNSTWGDVVGSCPGTVCKPADGNPGLDDVLATLGFFGDVPWAPLQWLDIAPATGSQATDKTVGVQDLLAVLAGFGGSPYPGNGPLNCATP